MATNNKWPPAALSFSGGARFWLLIPVILLLSFNGVNSRTVNDFRLKNTDGKFVSLKDYKNVKGFIVVFTCNHCPFAKLYFQRLNELNKKYKALGVPVIAVCSTDTVNFDEDTYAKMLEKAKKEKINYPYLCDDQQTVAKDFAAQKTPHAFVVWKDNGAWVIKYNGAIDDNGAQPQKVQRRYVADAVDALLKGQEVAVKEVKSIGCQIGFRQK